MPIQQLVMANSEKFEYFTIGSQVKIVTSTKKEWKGEIVAFDYETKTLMLKCPSAGQHGRFDIQVFNLEFVGEVEVIGEQRPSCIPEPLPPVSIPKVTGRLKQNLAERKKMLMYIGKNVSQEGQKLMDSVSKTIEECKWDNDNIMVMDTVVITPPYTAGQCRVIPGKETQPKASTILSHIRKIVDKHQQDFGRQAHSQNDTRRSMSPSPAPSSSSTSSAS